MKKQILLSLTGLAFATLVHAHDEGHGPKVSDTGRYGGLVSAVVQKADAAKGAGAELVYNSELSRATDTVRVYLYDKDMKPLDLKGFDKKADAILAAKLKGKWKDVKFTLELKGQAFEGKMPKAHAKPYNIDVSLKKDGKELLTAFDNLD